MNCWTNRSITVGIPSGLCSPLSLGMYTRLIGDGLYSPFLILSVSSPGCSKKYFLSSPVPIPSTPAEPLLASTFSRAWYRFFGASIPSNVIVSKASLLISSILATSANLLTCFLRRSAPPCPGQVVLTFFCSRRSVFLLSRVYWFGPSSILMSTMAPADFLPFVVTTTV